MILVISGSQKFQLNRLFEAIDIQAASGQIQDEIFAQIGASDYQPKNYAYENFLPKNRFEEMIEKADLVITHSGVGTILSSLQKGKRVIVFPRLAQYHESVDDHQVQIAQNFEKKNWVLVCRDEKEMADVIRRSETYPFAPYQSQNAKVLAAIRDYLDSI